MASFTTKFLKKRFVKAGDLTPVAEQSSKSFQLINKPTQGGASVAEPCIFSGPQGFSYSLTAAQAVAAQSDRGSSAYEEWVSTFGQYFGAASISARAVAGAKTDADAYLRQVTETLENSAISFASIAARKIWGPIGGSIGRILDLDEGGTEGEILLYSRDQASNFAPGIILQAGDGNGNGAPSNVRSGLGYVISVNYDADTSGDVCHIKVANSEANRLAGTVGKPTGWADDDYLFRNGDVAASTDLSDAQVRSMQAWCTLTAATDSYNGVARGQHNLLSGFRCSATEVAGLSVLDRCMLLLNRGAEDAGASPDYLGMSPKTWGQLQADLISYGTLRFEKDVRLGMEMISLSGPNGTVKVLNDRAIRDSDIWAITSSSMKVYNYDGFPALTDHDGVEMLRQASAASYEIRFHAFNSLTVSGRPWDFGRCSSGN